MDEYETLKPFYPLHYAACHGDVKVVQYLVQGQECSVDQIAWGGPIKYATPLHCASWHGHLDIVLLLLEHGADANIQNGYGWTALNGAIWHRFDKMALILIKYTDVNLYPEFRYTPLMSACAKGSVEVVRSLLEHGADVHVVTSHPHYKDVKWTALYAAKETRNMKILELVINALSRKEKLTKSVI